MSEYVRRNYDDVLRANSALLIRAEAAEARCERLADILREAIEWDGHDSEGIPAVWMHKAATELQQMGAALSDTAQTQKGQPPGKG